MPAVNECLLHTELVPQGTLTELNTEGNLNPI